MMKTIGNVRVASWSAGTARLVLADPVAVAESLFNRQDYGKGSSTASAGSASHHCRNSSASTAPAASRAVSSAATLKGENVSDDLVRVATGVPCQASPPEASRTALRAR